MGYDTAISGVFEIEPKLPDDFIEKFNRVGNMRNGSPGSFAEEYPDDPPPEGIEGWCDWRLTQQQAASWAPYECTRLEIGDGGEYGTLYGFEDWLVYAVRRIVRENPGVRFKGMVTWDGDDSEDFGKIEIVNEGEIIVSHGEITYTEYTRYPAPVAEDGRACVSA